MRDWEADRKLCAAATPGPWVREYDDLSEEEIISPTGYYGYGKSAANCYADGDFIAAAREGWPAALEEIEQMTRTSCWLREALKLIVVAEHKGLPIAYASQLARTALKEADDGPHAVA